MVVCSDVSISTIKLKYANIIAENIMMVPPISGRKEERCHHAARTMAPFLNERQTMNAWPEF